MNNLNTCIEYLNKGLEFKAQGNFEDALKEYNKAKLEYPTYKHTYNNIAKILFASNEARDTRLLNFLTYAHLTMLTDEYSQEGINFAWQNKFYDYDGFYLPNIRMNGFTCMIYVQEEPNLGNIFADINLTFNTGLAYILRNNRFISHNNIPMELIKNHIDLITGKNVGGPILGDSEYSSLIRVIGFIFLKDNMILNNSVDFASKVYFRPDYHIDDIG